MTDSRIRVSKDKAKLVQSLLAAENSSAPFQTYADIIAFAAVVGVKYGKRLPLGSEISKRDPAPIHRETFAAKGYETIMDILAVTDTEDPKILASTESESAERLKIFEEYANAGLEILASHLRGSIDYSLQLLLFLDSSKRISEMPNDEEFDLTQLL